MLAALSPLIAQYGTLAVALGCFIEGEITMFAGMLAAEGGLLTPTGVVATATLATFVGDNLWFQLGRFLGRPALVRCPRWHARAARVEALANRYGAPLMIGFRFLYGLRYVTPFVLASLRIPSWRFAFYDALGTLAWAGIIGVAAYYLASAARAVLGAIQHAELGLAGVLASAAAIAAALAWWRRRQRVSDRSSR